MSVFWSAFYATLGVALAGIVMAVCFFVFVWVGNEWFDWRDRVYLRRMSKGKGKA